MKVLVTGLSGFTGYYLKNELEAHDHTVVGLQTNLLDPIALGDEISQIEPDAVVHLAGIAFVEHGEPNDFYRVNLLGSRNLLSALTKLIKPLNAVLIASSANVYGNANVNIISEQTPVNPVNDYAVSKLAMEYMSRLWLDRLPIIIARPFNYTGLGQSKSFFVPKIVDHFVQKLPVIELGNLDIERDFSDVRMVVQIYRKLIESSAAVGETFNICSGKVYSLHEILQIMKHIHNRDIEIKINSTFVRSNEVRKLLGSKNKLEQYIGSIQYIPLTETLIWMSQKNNFN
jgi:nucleoside-diphosphate-sugar epimerase